MKQWVSCEIDIFEDAFFSLRDNNTDYCMESILGTIDERSATPTDMLPAFNRLGSVIAVLS